MNIGIFQDLHANLPALKKALEVFRDHQCSRIYHVGDLIGIGPYPKEVIDMALSIPEMEFIMGNHDHWYAYGLPQPIPDYMNGEEVAHHLWTHQQIGEKHRSIVLLWEWKKSLYFPHGKKVTFQHYGLDEERKWFKSFVKTPDARGLDQLFEGSRSDLIFYGHDHRACDLGGNSRYVNLGSAGCFDKAEVSIGILKVSEDNLTLKKLSVPYLDNGLMEAFEERKVPATSFITRTFITRKRPE